MTKRLEWASVCVIAVCAFTTAWLASNQIKIWHDSIHYSLVSQNLLLGKGLRTPVIHPWDTSDSSGTVPLTVHPPLLPMLFAAMGGASPGEVWPGRVVNIVGHVMTAVCVFVIVRKLVVGLWPATAAGLCMAVSYPMLRMAGVMMAEDLSIGLFMAALMFLVLSRDSDMRAWFELLCGLFTAAAFSARYGSVSLLPVLGWQALVVWRTHGLRFGVRTLVLTCGLPAVVVGLLWSRNLMVHGTIRGIAAPDMGRSMWEVLPGVAEISLNQMGVWWGLGSRTIAAIVFVGVPGAFCLLEWRRLRGVPVIFRCGLDLVLLAGVAYFLMLTQTIRRYEPHFELRYAMPLAPLIVVCVVAVVAGGWRALFESRFGLPAKAAWYGSLAVLVSFSIMVTIERRRDDLVNNRMISRIDGIPDSQTFVWVREHLEAGSVVASNKAFEISYLTGWSSLNLPSRAWNKKWDLPEDMGRWLPDKMRRVRAEHLVLMTPVGGSLPADHVGVYVAAMSRRELVDDQFTLVFAGRDGVVYRLNEERNSTIKK